MVGLGETRGRMWRMSGAAKRASDVIIVIVVGREPDVPGGDIITPCVKEPERRAQWNPSSKKVIWNGRKRRAVREL